jgi:hypothetical protein
MHGIIIFELSEDLHVLVHHELSGRLVLGDVPMYN